MLSSRWEMEEKKETDTILKASRFPVFLAPVEEDLSLSSPVSSPELATSLQALLSQSCRPRGRGP